MSTALETFARARAELIERGGPYASIERSAAWNRFSAAGLPSARSEDWKYTPPAALFEGALISTEPAQLTLPPLLPHSARLVLVNGRADPTLSSGYGWFQMAPSTAAGPLEKPPYRGALEALNLALFEEAALIDVAPAQDAGVLELIHVTHGGTVHPRVRIRLAEGARLTLVETFLGGEGSYLVNAVTESFLAQGSELRHYAVQDDGRAGRHHSSVSVQQEARSRFFSHNVQLGGRISRREVRVQLAGEAAEAEVHGLSLNGGRHHDLHVEIDHQRPACSSSQRFRAVLDSGARAVFTAKTRIQPGAQKTQASQHARALILNEGCEADLRPHLEIHADDVKAAHGATVGELDPEQVFYLRSRGIPEKQARSLLTQAFAAELLSSISPIELRERVEARVLAAEVRV